MMNVPEEYKYNSRVNRLKFLAGFLDASSSYNKMSNTFEVKKNKLVKSIEDDIIFICRSLGLSCCYKQYTLNISGNVLHDIPSKKTKIINKIYIKNNLTTNIRVEYANEDEYYGFTLDGNCRYLLGDFTVTHNTCSAIGVCEEMRDYMKQMGIKKRIIIVASENVQDNFKLQLFDERKLKLIDGVWNIRACTGNKLLQEINPMNMNGMTKEKIVNQIKNLINTYYIFLGYVQFANYIIKTMSYTEEIEKQNKGKTLLKKSSKIELNNKIMNRIRKEFDNRLIVIDEVHNIRKTDDNENKKVAVNLELLVKSAKNMRLLFLSATPMYNSYKEIVWLLNLMNTNDRRGKVDVKDIFDKYGNFKKKGEDTLIQKATGYVSFVRGENPYIFPYRVYPDEFAQENTFPAIEYPSYQMNLKKIKNEDKKRILSLYLTKLENCENCGKCQFCVYKYIIYNLRNKEFTLTTKTGIVREMPSFENMESFGYNLLQIPLESLIISYPINGLKEILDDIPVESLDEELTPSFSELSVQEDDEDSEDASKKEVVDTEPLKDSEDESRTEETEGTEETERKKSLQGGSKKNIDPHTLTGRTGLERMMNYTDTRVPPMKGNFEYRKDTLKNYGKMFSKENIGKYSSKIKCILENIAVSEGVILIYSQYIDSGLIPVALALEEMGFTRYGDGAKPLFKTVPSPLLDVTTMEPIKDKKNSVLARYSMITGDPRLSPNNDFEVKGVTGDDNRDGKKVKVVLISRAGSEGIDFKYIRQVHILEPWYNMNRIEQIIGRGVRNFSHKDLPFEKRNVQIFMYGTILGDNTEESADLYVYRVAEYKAIQIGKVTRVLKETAVDCIIHHEQTNFTQQKIMDKLDKSKTSVMQILSNGIKIENFKIGDAPFSPACDYMEKCDYKCRPNATIDESNLNEDTYDEKFILVNSEKILQRIRNLMKENFFYKKEVLLREINAQKDYPQVQIFAALTQLIEDQHEFITDKYGRDGRLINIGEYYLFQPVELSNKNSTVFERSVPIDYKHNMAKFIVKKNIENTAKLGKIFPKKITDVREEDQSNEDSESDESDKVGNQIFKEIQKLFDTSIEFTKKVAVPRGSDNWYEYCGIVMKKMVNDYPDSKELLIPFLVAHIIELQLYDEKLSLMNYLYSLKKIKEKTLQWYAKEYFLENSIITPKFTSFIMYKLGKRMIMILDENNRWVEAQPEDQREIALTKSVKELLTFNANDYNKIIGFIGYEKSNRYLVFKTKDITSKRDTGARCDESGKSKTMKLLNDILREEKYTKENTKMQKKDGEIIVEAVGQSELCVLQEFLLRYFNAVKKEGKKWFLTPEFALWFKMYPITN
jgi:hypothetical protein